MSRCGLRGYAVLGPKQKPAAERQDVGQGHGLAPAVDTGRDLSLDALRGFAILVVVLGHAIQFNMLNPFDVPLERVIISFEMPLFFFISGYLAYRRVEHRLGSVVKRKFLQLAVPFFAWAVVTSLLHDYTGRSIPRDIWQAATTPMSGLWFLWVLFLAFCVMALLRVSWRIPAWIALPIGWYAIYRLGSHVPGQAVSLLATYFPFFAAGYLYMQHRRSFTRIRLPLFVVSLVLFAVLVLGWQMWGVPSFVTHLVGWAPLGLHVGNYLVLFYGWVVAFAGIGTFWGLFMLSGGALGPARRTLAWFGLVTFDIYVSQSIFIQLGWWPSHPQWLAVLVAFIAGIVGSLALSLLLRQTRISARLFLGSGSLPRTLFPPIQQRGSSGLGDQPSRVAQNHGPVVVVRSVLRRHRKERGGMDVSSMIDSSTPSTVVDPATTGTTEAIAEQGAGGRAEDHASGCARAGRPAYGRRDAPDPGCP